MFPRSMPVLANVPPPPCPRTTLRKNQPLVPRSNSRITFFYQGSGFFMFLVDVGQLFRCAGHHFMCVTTGPPIRGTLSVTHRRTYPLNPSPLLSTPSPKQSAPDKKQTNVSETQGATNSTTLQILFFHFWRTILS